MCDLKQKRRGGYTLLELLMVIVIIGLLAGMLTSALQYAKYNARKTRTYSDCKTLAAMLWNYRQEYGRWPCDSVSGVRFFVDNNYRVKEHIEQNNPRGVQFANWSEYIIDTKGNLCDPWGAPYGLIFDLDLDRGSVSNSTLKYVKAF